jgi:hypothetical protein
MKHCEYAPCILKLLSLNLATSGLLVYKKWVLVILKRLKTIFFFTNLPILNKSVLWHHIYLKLASLFEKKTHILAFFNFIGSTWHFDKGPML